MIVLYTNDNQLPPKDHIVLLRLLGKNKKPQITQVNQAKKKERHEEFLKSESRKQKIRKILPIYEKTFMRAGGFSMLVDDM